MASIKKREDGTWRAQVEKNGHRASKLFGNQREAQHWAVRKELEFAGLAGQDKGRTFAAAAALYVQTVSIHKKDGAVDWEANRFAQFAEFFGETTLLATITPARIGQWRDELLKTVAPSTVARYKNLLSNLFKVALNEWGWIKSHPFQGVKMPGEDEAVRIEFVWGWRDIRRILRHCEASDGAKTQEVGRALAIALRTGMRLKEVLAARLVGRVIVIDDTKTTKKGKIVRIPTTHQGRLAMKRHASTPFTVEPNEASTLFHGACVACGLRFPYVDGVTFNDSRATALTHMSRKMPVQVLQRISRHRDINILVNTYYRETAEQIAARL